MQAHKKYLASHIQIRKKNLKQSKERRKIFRTSKKNKN